jgi:hypothetical protein
MEILKDKLYNSNFFRKFRRKSLGRRAIKELQPWAMNGFPLPPPHIVKQLYLHSLAKKYKLTTLIETGTYLGDMIFALEPYFKDIFSIEIDETLYSKAKQRFKNSKNITLLHGDSGRVLQNVIAEIQKPSLIWLDGHYSGPGTGIGDMSTPIINELNAISEIAHSDSLILIDDIHCFNGTDGYPDLDELIHKVRDINFTILENRLNMLSLKK